MKRLIVQGTIYSILEKIAGLVTTLLITPFIIAQLGQGDSGVIGVAYVFIIAQIVSGGALTLFIFFSMDKFTPWPILWRSLLAAALLIGLGNVTHTLSLDSIITKWFIFLLFSGRLALLARLFFWFTLRSKHMRGFVIKNLKQAYLSVK